MLSTLALSLALSLSSAPAEASAPRQLDATIQTVEGLVWNEAAARAAQAAGLSLVNVTWEDTGRSKESVWGPNISDMTIGVRDSRGELHAMPVLRFDNYTDETVDIEPDRFMLSVGNERGRGLRTVSLADLLEDTREYLHDPESWAGRNSSLAAKRDSHVIVSAQACLLPVPKAGEATFTPVIYNYQSSPGNPAVLTIVATREGTSIQVVDNDGGYMSDVLFFNDDGERAPFTAMRLSDHRAASTGISSGRPELSPEDDDAAGADVVLVVQVPLKQRQLARQAPSTAGAYLEDAMEMAAPASADRSDIEAAVIGHGPTEGPFAELAGLDIERDERFPVRVTVQFYKATTTGTLTEADARALRADIDKVYGDPAYVSSLVTDGWTGRPTEWQQAPTETATWARPSWGWLKAR